KSKETALENNKKYVGKTIDVLPKKVKMNFFSEKPGLTKL
ncbi:unnamed protein product, partial [marine sediment metagenome]